MPPMRMRRIEEATTPRFNFGANWRAFLERLSPEQVEEAKGSLLESLGDTPPKKATFLDVGSGSGLFSLSARMLGLHVHSFDFDAECVACAETLKERFFPGDPQWRIERGSILDASYVASLGPHDVVYSWGVLHHTGDMQQALEAVMGLVAPGGTLCIALYNDQGFISRYWLGVKRLYNRGPLLRALMIAVHFPYLVALRFLVRALTGRLRLERGMSLWWDMKDWLGGYPFEVARPDDIVALFAARGFGLLREKRVGRRMGCNEFVFRKPAA
jgi:2-polyprenyl-3-methyl-5-hydroxy-6-metoxy-1,4-benzoquinol methylase